MMKKSVTISAIFVFILGLAFSICGNTYGQTCIYAWGGREGGYTSAVYSASVGLGGGLSPWVSQTPLPQALCEAWGVAIGNNIFSLAGTETTGVYIPDVYVTQAGPSCSNSSWTSTTSLPKALYQPCIVADCTGSYLCSIGGASDSVYIAPVSGATIGPWIAQTPFSVGLIEHSAVYDSSTQSIFVLGLSTPLVYSASFSGGFLGTGNLTAFQI